MLVSGAAYRDDGQLETRSVGGYRAGQLEPCRVSGPAACAICRINLIRLGAARARMVDLTCKVARVHHRRNDVRRMEVTVTATESWKEVPVNRHYDSQYYALQRECGAYSAEIDLFKFQNEVAPSDRVLDFGCGGGFLLSRLSVREKMGIEINPVAAADARRSGVRVADTLRAVPDGWADVVISHHALEHVDRPLDVVRELRTKLRPGGKMVLVTPSETIAMRYRDDDPNFHLYTWSPSNLGNLLKRAGFDRIRATPVYHRWPPFWFALRRVLPRPAMQALCVLRGRLDTRYCQVKAVGYAPGEPSA
jgi:2-polyprenyl-3-methyl-5-hydroxy-6-metoxy-1,4-benzoquinol methylase